MLLIIGNKNYSSWSFRPWIAMKATGIAFEERLISLNDPEFKRAIAPVSQNGKVPALDDGGVHVWESLAILEYLAEKFPHAGLWPDDPPARAHARAIPAAIPGRFRRPRPCPCDRVGNPRRLRRAAERMPDEFLAPGEAARPERRRARRCHPHRCHVERR